MIEKRFLLKDENIENLLEGVKSTEVEEFFTTINSCKKIKYIALDNKYFKEKQVGSSDKSKSKIKSISLSKFNKKKKCSIGKILKKQMFKLDDKNKKVVYSYGKSFHNLNIMNAKFKSVKKLDKFKESELFNYIKEDVSSIDSFSETALVLLGSPLTFNYNVYKLFKEIESDQNFSIKNIIHSDMKVDDALRVKLYELYLNHIQLGNNILEKSSKNQFISYKKSVDNIYTILLEFKEYFDAKLYSRVIEHLKIIQSNCDIQKDVKPIKKSLTTITKCLGEEKTLLFLNEFDKNINKKSQPFKKFLKTREYAIIMKQLELLIKESSYNSYKSTHYKSIKMILDKKINTRYNKSLKTIDKYIDCQDKVSYKKIQIQLDRVMILISEFNFLFKEEDFYKAKKTLLRVKSSFDNFLIPIQRNIIMQENIDLFNDIKCLKNDFSKNKDELAAIIKKDVKKYKKFEGIFV